jgi:cadherin-like protein/Big-like domain-containing protein/Calx-beta domain-containing protein
MSLRLQANSRLLFRFILSHRVLFITLVAMLVLAGVGISKSSAVKSTLSVITGNSELAASTKTPAGTITVHAAGRGKPYLNFQDGSTMKSVYRGDSLLANALQTGSAKARSLASADFDSNGATDMVVGYAFNSAGMITLQRGNPDAFAPADDSVFVRVQQGYNPSSFLPEADVYALPVSPDLLVAGNFTQDSVKDVLFAAKGGALYLMAGDGSGRLGGPQQIDLPGPVTALAAGEFRAADGFTDVAVSVTGPGGEALLIFDGAEGLSNALVQYQLSAPASAIEFGGLDDDPFMDVAVAAGKEVVAIHGWSRKEQVVAAAREERIPVASGVRGLAVGEFAWDRQARTEIAALSPDGTVHIVQNAKADRRPYTEAEKAQRTRGNLKPQERISQDIESAQSWQPGQASGWSESSSFSATSSEEVLKANLAGRETDDLMLMGSTQPKLEIVSTSTSSDVLSGKTRGGLSATSESTRISLDVETAPVAVLTLPKKINGTTDIVVLESTGPSIVPNAPNTTITVDRTDDPSGAALTAASACTAAGNDCSLRGAIQFANLPSNNNTTISLPANTYILSINGTNQGGCDGNTVGDLGANQTMSITGAGAATTIIRQTGTGPANDGDRVMCMNEPFTTGLIYNFSGVTFVGGRDGTAAGGGAALGGGGIIGGELNNSLTMTNVVMANNQVTVLGSANLGGGAIQITGGNLIITNSTIGGSAAPGAYTDRTSTTTANLQAGSGGGVTYTPSSPQHTGGTGTLTVTGSTFSRNTAAGIGGGGADLLIFAFAAPGGIGSGTASIGTSTFSNNQGLGTASGGGIIVESLPTTVATTSFTNNSVGNRGGGIFVGGGSLLLNGTTPSISFTGNTATLGGSSVATSAPVNVDGTNTTIGGDIEIGSGGTWTNNAGSTLAPTNILMTGGTFNMNNSTMNVSGNLTISPGAVVGSTFNGNTGTVNIQGNFVLNAGGAPATTLNAGTGTFNFNGTGVQSISNGTSITFFNLTDSNITNALTLNNSLAVNGTLNVNGVNAILSPVAGAVISGTGTLTGTGTARASRIAATPDFLSQYTITNKTLTNLQIDYNGTGNQTVNNTPAYSRLRISGSGTKTLQGNTVITSNLDIIAGATFAASTFNFALGGNWTNGGTFTPGTGAVTFQGTTGTQLLTGNTTFFNLTLNNNGATTNFNNTTTTVGNDLVATAGTMDGSTSTIVFTGVTDNAGSISGAAAKNFFNLQINSPAVITHNAGANITIENNYSNAGTFNQGAGLTTIFDVDNTADGAHTLSGAGTTIFGNVTINASNTVDAGTHSFNVIGSAFAVAGTFTGNASSVAFNGGVAQSITGDGAKNFSGLLINNVNGVQVANGTGAVDAFVGGLLTLNTDLTVAAGAILQQGGTSTGVADVLGTVRRTDLGGVTRSFGNLNNQITINSGTAPTSLDFNLAKVTPTGFPAGVRVVPRTYALSPTGGAGISATLRLRYIDPTELVGPGITESRLVLWKDTTGSDNWVAQGGTVDTAGNHVTHTGISSFSEWAIAEASDLTLSKANNVSGSAVVGQSWNWTLTAANTGSPATFTAGQTIITDNLPNSNIVYGTPTVQNVSNITGSANISCSIVSNDLTCVASGGSVTFASDIGASNFDVVFSATAQAAGSYQNPRTGGGIAQIDPNNLIAESNETNNSPANNTVTVGKANTTTAITSDNPDPSVVGQAVTVQWSVTVNAPGAVGAPLTGNVTVSDGTNNCTAAVSAGQCDVTFTSAGAKSLTATYAGDSNYNGSASTPATPHTVNKADTTTTITSDNPDPSTPGQSVTVQWTTTVNSPGAGTPTGNVTVTVSGGAETCSAAVAAGQCSLVLNATGLRTITATYAGDTNFNTSSDTEDHTVCGSSLVTTTADSGAGSLRQIIADACDNSTITFDSAGAFATPQTITLTTGEILIDKNLTINAGTSQITLSGGSTSRVFNINAAKTVGIVGLSFTGGSTTGDGAAIVNNGALTVANSTFFGNAAGADGGAISTTATATSLTLINTTISGNTAGGSGGGLITLGGTVTIINTTITNNSADQDSNNAGDGGGIRAHAGTVTLKNTIVAGNFNENTPAADTADDISGTVDAASSFNLIGTGGSGGLTNGVNSNQVGVANAGLGALANNGGTTQTHALLSTSPAIEAGSNANLPLDTLDLDADADTAETLPVDQRGKVSVTIFFPRVADSNDPDAIQTVDIGAYEAHPTVDNITDKTTAEDTAVPQITFNIGDGTGALITSVTATSSNTTLIPNANVVVNGSGTTRTLDISPALNANSPADGTSTITVTVTATNGQTATDTFVVTVTEVNDAPVPTNDTIADINEDSGVYTIPFATLLANDTNKGAANESGQTLTITAVSAPTGGTVIINGTNVEFTPTPNYFGPAGFTYTVTDNGTTNGGSDPKTGNATVSFNIIAVNDPPSFTIAADPPPVAQDAGPQTVLNFATSISPGPNETGQTLTFNITPGPTTGTLTFSAQPAIDTTTGTLTYTANNSTSGTAQFSVTLSDNGGGTNTSAPQSFTITVVPPNATPVVTTTAGNLAYTENAGAVVIDSGVTVTDSDSTDLTGATVSITAGFVSAQDTLAFTNQLGITGNYNSGSGVLTLSGTTTVANYQTALRSVTYANSSDDPTTSRTITFSATDGFTIGSATRGITITAVNDGPVNTVPGPQSTNEDTGKVFSSGNGNQISVADVDLGANPIKITLTATNGIMSLSTIGGLSFTTGTGINDGTMVFTGLLPAVNTALNGMSFNPTANFNGAASIQIISDDQGNTGTGGALTDTDTVNITVIGFDDAPSIITSSGSLAYTENDAPTAIDPGLTVTDIDSANLVGASVAITTNFVSGQDVLVFTNQLGITGSYNSGTGILTLTGTSSVANYQTALRSVAYQNSSDNPSTSPRAATFAINDGTSTVQSTRGITITAVNDAPVNTVPGSVGTPQNTPIVFAGVNAISVADPDVGGNTIQVTLTATNGTLTLSGTSGLSFSFSDANGTGAGDGTADATMTFRGTLVNVNAALNGMTFTPTAGFTGGASLTITSNDLGNTGTGGPLTDTDSVSILVALNVSIQDSQLVEPSTGTANMVFTVTLSAPAPAGGASVSFTTQDMAPALNHATAGEDYTLTSGIVSFAQGEQFKTINVPILSDNKPAESPESFLVVLSNPVGASLARDTATGTILIVAQASQILISELRTSGPAGAGDDFVEIYNNSDQPHIVNDGSGINDANHGYGLFKMGTDCNSNPVLIGVIPNGTTIPARGHYLFVGSAYSLANYGGSGAAAGDQVMTQDIENDRNVALFKTASLINLSALTRWDAAGFGANTGGTCDLLREGATLTPMAGSTLEYSFFRDECGKQGNPATFGLCPTGGFHADTENNSKDFVFADTSGSVTPAGQRLGAPGPQNLGSPRLNLSVPSLPLDATKGLPSDPNRLRDTTPQLPNAMFGTLSVRRRFVNTTGAPITRLRFRLVDFSSFAGPGAIADLRALSSLQITVNGVNDAATCAATGTPTTAPCSVPVFGTTVEQPPTQSLGGALNSSMSAGTITVPTPLAPGQSINLQFLLGVQQTGAFKFFFNIEALP